MNTIINMSQPNEQQLEAEAIEQFHKEVPMVSGCCGAEFNNTYQEEMGFCADCKDHCGSEPMIDFNSWLSEQK